ncbi:MAG: carbon-nitrogen hydrolase family protein [Thermoplasmatota archaeon]
MAAAKKFTVAIVQDSPVFLDRDATIAKVETRVAEAAKKGAKLVAFPESFVPTYPAWVWSLAAKEYDAWAELHAEFVSRAVSVPSEATRRLGALAKKHKVYLTIGVTERSAEGNGTTLYNTLLTFAPDGALLGAHRKLMPTAGERMVWAPGDGSTLHVYDTALGKLGGLICWENYMPLARTAMYAKGIELYVAPTYDRGEPWLSTMRHVATEGKCFVLGCGTLLNVRDVPARLRKLGKLDEVADKQGWINTGTSLIVDPEGTVLAGPLDKKAGILTAEIDPAKLSGPKWMLDVVGHYSRPDIFSLTVNTDARATIATNGDGSAPSNGNAARLEAKSETTVAASTVKNTARLDNRAPR